MAVEERNGTDLYRKSNHSHTKNPFNCIFALDFVPLLHVFALDFILFTNVFALDFVLLCIFAP